MATLYSKIQSIKLSYKKQNAKMGIKYINFGHYKTNQCTCLGVKHVQILTSFISPQEVHRHLPGHLIHILSTVCLFGRRLMPWYVTYVAG